MFRKTTVATSVYFLSSSLTLLAYVKLMMKTRRNRTLSSVRIQQLKAEWLATSAQESAYFGKIH